MRNGFREVERKIKVKYYGTVMRSFNHGIEIQVQVPSYSDLPRSRSLAACPLPRTLGLSRSNGSEYAVFLCDSLDENVEMELLTLTVRVDFVRNGFSTLPRWLSVRPAAPAALCRGARLGRWGLAGDDAAASSFSSGGVMNGSSGGRCWTIGNDVADG